MEKISAVIVNYNSGKHLSRCLSALTRQRLSLWKTLVIDNASKDASLTDLTARFPEVELIKLSKNSGFAAANNIGIHLAKDSEWIALLNPDAFPKPDWLKRLLEAAQNFPEYACFASRLLLADNPTHLDGVGDVYHVSGRVWRRGHSGDAGKIYLTPEEIFSPCAAAALYRRDAFLEVGGFDEDFFCYLEDVDLGFRLRLAGYKCLYVPEAVVHHVGSATTGRRSDFSVYYGHRNLVWTYFKNMPWPLFWWYLPQHLLLNLVSLLWCTLRGQGRVIFKAKWDAIRGIPKMWKKRGEIQAKRKVRALEIRRLMAKGLPFKH